MTKQPKQAPKTVPCPDCGGSGSIVWGTEDVKCAGCDGTGKVKASDAR